MTTLTKLLASPILNFITLMLKILSSPVHVTGQHGKISTPTAWTEKAPVTSLGAIEAAPVQAEKFTAWEIKLERRKVNEDWSQQIFYTCNSLIIPEHASGTGASLCRMKLASCFDVSLCGTVWGDSSENSRASAPPDMCSYLSIPRTVFLWDPQGDSVCELRAVLFPERNKRFTYRSP